MQAAFLLRTGHTRAVGLLQPGRQAKQTVYLQPDHTFALGDIMQHVDGQLAV